MSVQTARMICFSKNWHTPLLRSHYADKHRGICLGFDVDEDHLNPVKYVATRQSLKIPLTPESVEQLLYTKYRDWRYEEEWRNWFRFDKREDGHYFYSFDEFVRLREVIVGPLCTVPKEVIEEALQGYQDSVTITKLGWRLGVFESSRIYSDSLRPPDGVSTARSPSIDPTA